MVTSYIIENDREFARQLDRLSELTNNMKVPFSLIAMDFYRSEKMIFALKGPGLYPDLATSTKIQKIYYNPGKGPGSEYPILFRTGRLARSLLSSTSPESDFSLTKSELIMGTKVPYAIFHQSDEPRTRLPQRKVVFIDGGPLERSKGANKSGRRDRWEKIIFSYIQQILNEG